MNTKTYLFSASKEILFNTNINRNYSSKADSSISKKTKSIQKRFLIVPHKDLHPDLKSTAAHIKFQKIARIGGALLYPSLSLFGLPFFIFFTPVCVGTHHVSIKYAYRAALEIFKSGDIVVNADLNHEIRSKMIARSLSRFHFNYKGDLVLHMDNSAPLSFSRFKGIRIHEDTKNNSLSCKLNTIKDKIFPQSKFQISYFHLEEDVQKQVKQVLTARQLRFRACMGTVLATSTLGSSFDLLQNMSVGLTSYVFLGLIMQSVNSKSFRVSKHTNDVWKSIHQKKEFIDIIKPEYRKLYQRSDFNKDIYLTISLFGNIQYHDQNPASFRKSYLLKQVHRDENKPTKV